MSRRNEVRSLLEQGFSNSEIAKLTSLNKSTISYYRKKLNFPPEIRKLKWEEINEFYQTHNRKETMNKFNISNGSWYYALKMNHLHRKVESGYKIALSDLLVAGRSLTGRNNLKNRLIKEGILELRCYANGCKLTTEWNGLPLRLHIDHINGIKDDNRIENLRLLCPNCHSQTETYSGRNVKR